MNMFTLVIESYDMRHRSTCATHLELLVKSKIDMHKNYNSYGLTLEISRSTW